MVLINVTRKKSPNVYKSCPKMILLEKLKKLTPLQKLPLNVSNLGKIIVVTGFEKLPKVQSSSNLVTLIHKLVIKSYLVKYFNLMHKTYGQDSTKMTNIKSTDPWVTNECLGNGKGREHSP